MKPSTQPHRRLSSTIALCLCLAALLLLLPAQASAQDPAPADPPMPAPFASAKTVFLASAGAPSLGGQERLCANIIYQAFYHATTDRKQYTLTTSPDQADLLFEGSIVIAPRVSPEAFGVASVQLLVRDRRTHAILWVFDQPLRGAFRESKFRKNVEEAASQIADDLKSAARGHMPTP
jgi:hypothetical protein